MPHRLNIGDQGWRKSEELLRIEEELRHVMQGPQPLNEPIALNLGIQDGRNGTPRRELLQSAFRCDYISGYTSGSWERYTLREWQRRGYEGATYYLNDDSYRTIHDELFDLMFMPRYPHDPPVWYAYHGFTASQEHGRDRVSHKKQVRFNGLLPNGISRRSDGAPDLCGNCGVWVATHFYDVELDGEWIEDIGWCAACAMLADASGILKEACT